LLVFRSLRIPLRCTSLFFSHAPSPLPPLYTLSLHDALPICPVAASMPVLRAAERPPFSRWITLTRGSFWAQASHRAGQPSGLPRSEEHTSELQSRFDLVCRLLLEKKKEIKPTESRVCHISRQ